MPTTTENDGALEISSHLWAAVRAVASACPPTDAEKRRTREYAKAIIEGCLHLVQSGDLDALLLAEALAGAATFVFMTAVEEGDLSGRAIERVL